MTLRFGTPVDVMSDGLRIKREDLACGPPGPAFSKMRGVLRRVRSRSERMIAALDTFHSQAGHAVAYAAALTGRQAVVYWPARKADGYIGPGTPLTRDPQKRAADLGAELVALRAGRSCVLFHAARRLTEQAGGYMMPNGLQLEESVEETASEVGRTDLTGVETLVVPASSGTIAAGVLRGLIAADWSGRLIVHLGYSRPGEPFVRRMTSGLVTDGLRRIEVSLVDEGYGYADQAADGETPQFPCSGYYDLKAYRWLRKQTGIDLESTLFWNIG